MKIAAIAVGLLLFLNLFVTFQQRRAIQRLEARLAVAPLPAVVRPDNPAQQSLLLLPGPQAPESGAAPAAEPVRPLPIGAVPGIADLRQMSKPRIQLCMNSLIQAGDVETLAQWLRSGEDLEFPESNEWEIGALNVCSLRGCLLDALGKIGTLEASNVILETMRTTSNAIETEWCCQLLDGATDPAIREGFASQLRVAAARFQKDVSVLEDRSLDNFYKSCGKANIVEAVPVITSFIEKFPHYLSHCRCAFDTFPETAVFQIIETVLPRLADSHRKDLFTWCESFFFRSDTVRPRARALVQRLVRPGEQSDLQELLAEILQRMH